MPICTNSWCSPGNIDHIIIIIRSIRYTIAAYPRVLNAFVLWIYNYHEYFVRLHICVNDAPHCWPLCDFVCSVCCAKYSYLQCEYDVLYWSKVQHHHHHHPGTHSSWSILQMPRGECARCRRVVHTSYSYTFTIFARRCAISIVVAFILALNRSLA